MRKLLLVLFVALMILVGCVNATNYDMGTMDGTIETIETHYYDSKYEVYNYAVSPYSSTKINRINLWMVEHWETIDMILVEVAGITTYSGGNKHPITLKMGGTTYCGSGYISTWAKNATHSKVLIELNDYDRGTATGDKTILITYDDGGSIYTTSRITPPGSPSAEPHVFLGDAEAGALGTNVEVWSHDTYYLKVERDGSNIDEENCTYINSWNLYRYDSSRSKWTYSSFDLRDADDNVYHQSSSGSVNIYNVSSLTAPIIMTVNYGNPSIWEDSYTWSGSSTCYPEGTPTLTPTPTPYVPSENCGIVSSLTFSKYNNIFPISEYVTGALSLTGSVNLPSGSSITWMVKPAPGSPSTLNPYSFATFSNVSGTWYVNRNDLGNITTPVATTYLDSLSETLRFPDAGNYIVRVAIFKYDTSCQLYSERVLSVIPTSGVNVDFYFYDGLTGGMLDDVTALISNINITGNASFSGNPIGYAANIGNNLSVYVDKVGYLPHHLYYTVPAVSGNTLNVPFYLFPDSSSEYYPDTTMWTVTVLQQTSNEPVYGAQVTASDSTGTIDNELTNGQGYCMLAVPYTNKQIKLETSAYLYQTNTQYVNLGNASTYATTVYLQRTGTPYPTPLPTYNPNATSTTTSTITTPVTTLPTSSVIKKYQCVFDVYSSSDVSPISGASVKLYQADKADESYKGALIYTAVTQSNGRTSPVQLVDDDAYIVEISKTGYFTASEWFRMPPYDATVYVALNPVGSGVTIVTTQPTAILPTPSGTGIQGGFIGWIIDYFIEWFGCDIATARILLGLFMVMCGAVFVGGALAGFGGGSGAATGALIGGIITFIMVCYMQLLPFWLIPVAIGLVGMSFFIWRRNDGD